MLTVITFGKFQITYDGKILKREEIASAMMEKLLMYLLLYRERSVTAGELMEALWQEDAVENPAGALKNLMYRLRCLLKKNFGEVNFIQSGRGSYGWNHAVKVEMDAEQFECLMEQAKCCEEKREKQAAVTYYEKSAALYQGEFMNGMQDMHWLMTRSAYYHSLFLQCVKNLSELYLQNEQYEKLEKLCNAALKQETLEEEIYYYQILAQIKSRKIPLALETCERAERMLAAELGVQKTEKLQKLYEELLRQGRETEAEDVQQMHTDMEEKEPRGAFLCGYPVFREIYRLERRKMRRMEKSQYLLVLTVETVGGEAKNVAAFRIRNAMHHLEKIVMELLRSGDVVAKCSSAQFMILLADCSFLNGQKVAERIVSRFHADYSAGRNIRIQIYLEA